MATGRDFTLTTEELRTVARFALTSAEEALEIFEAAGPDDLSDREAGPGTPAGGG